MSVRSRWCIALGSSVAACSLVVPTTLPDSKTAFDLCTSRVGASITVTGYETRPTVLQRSTTNTAPLLVMLHGMNGCIGQFQDATTLDEQVDTHVLWVTGGVGTGQRRSWDISTQTDDTYIASAVVTAVKSGISPSTTTLVGISNGAGMAVIALCRAPEIFSAAVSVASWQPGNLTCSDVNRSLFVATGTADLFAGVDINKKLGEMWRASATSCSGQPSTRIAASVTDLTWKSCSSGSTVRQVWVRGAGHGWLNINGFTVDDEIVLFVETLPASANELPAVD